MVDQPRDHSSTKDRIVQAALGTLKEEGFAGTSARAIAKRGGFNQALIFYHFGTLGDLLLSSLDQTSAERMTRYRESMGMSGSVSEKIARATALYREDLDSGHITVLSELIAGSLSRPDLAPEVIARMQPWIDFAEETIAELLANTAFALVVPARSLALAIVALYLGVDMLTHLDKQHSPAEELFAVAASLAPLLDSLVPQQGH
ncbi:MAG TPA: TetR family transcriptional regulator [Actinomycetota bacterium]|nr:TetR family transcriptional regulator [Actinomycetota bacterium]